MNDTTHVDDPSIRRTGGNRPETDPRPSSLRAAGGSAGLRWRLESTDRGARELLTRVSPLLLRISLGVVFVWFGSLKIAGASAVGGLVAGTVPFLDASWFVPVLGVLEVLMGLAFATGRFLRVVLPAFALHLGGTFLVLVLLPEVAFEGDNALMLTVVGEYVVKNLVLLSAGIVVASNVKPLRATGAKA
jgi:uncharacterized membrane protein YkgB